MRAYVAVRSGVGAGVRLDAQPSMRRAAPNRGSTHEDTQRGSAFGSTQRAPPQGSVPTTRTAPGYGDSASCPSGAGPAPAQIILTRLDSTVLTARRQRT
eukprot:423064-Prymnesium_polylepis.1